MSALPFDPKDVRFFMLSSGKDGWAFSAKVYDSFWNVTDKQITLWYEGGSFTFQVDKLHRINDDTYTVGTTWMSLFFKKEGE